MGLADLFWGFCITSLTNRKRYHFFETASLAHCQNFSAAGLSFPFGAAMPIEIGLGSGMRRTRFRRFPKL
jgi:hypothetical protein